MICRELLDLVEARRAIDLAIHQYPGLSANGRRPLRLAPPEMRTWEADCVLLQTATGIDYIAEGLLLHGKGTSLYSMKGQIGTWGRETGRAPYLLEGPLVAGLVYFGIDVVFDKDGFGYIG